MHDRSTFFVDVVVAVVFVDIVSVSSTENVSASLQGSTSSPHCLQKYVRNFISTFLSRYCYTIIRKGVNMRRASLPRGIDRRS